MCSALLPPDGPIRPSTRMKCVSIPRPLTSGTSSSWPYMLRIDWLRPADRHRTSSSVAPSASVQRLRCTL